LLFSSSGSEGQGPSTAQGLLMAAGAERRAHVLVVWPIFSRKKTKRREIAGLIRRFNRARRLPKPLPAAAPPARVMLLLLAAALATSRLAFCCLLPALLQEGGGVAAAADRFLQW